MRLTAAGVYALQLFDWGQIEKAILVLKSAYVHVGEYDKSDFVLVQLIE